MIRRLDASEQRIRTEVDELLRDYPQLTADALADRFETTPRVRTFSDPEFVRSIIGELRRRAYARVRYRPAPADVVTVHPDGNTVSKVGKSWTSDRQLQLVEDQSFWWQKG